jgi:hypothetical protein
MTLKKTAEEKWSYGYCKQTSCSQQRVKKIFIPAFGRTALTIPCTQPTTNGVYSVEAGSPLVDMDNFEKKRSEGNVFAGPFTNVKPGKVLLKVWTGN